MNKAQAWQILWETTGKITTDRAGHSALAQALAVLKPEAVDPMPVPKEEKKLVATEEPKVEPPK